MPALKEHAGFLGLVGGAMIAAGSGLLALGAIEVSGTKHAAMTNGWVRGGLVVLLIGLAVVVVAAVVYVIGARKPQPVAVTHARKGVVNRGVAYLHGATFGSGLDVQVENDGELHEDDTEHR